MNFFSLYMLSIIKDKRSGFIPFLIKGVLHAVSWIYLVSVKVIDQLYVKGYRTEEKADLPVISVGNITLGGTGKTPFTAFLSDHFVAKGFNPAILIRGYGNDENRMLRDENKGVSVFSGQDRVKNAQAALKNKNDLILLDDGFQHRRIKRDLNILLLDAAYPFGNGHIFPRGILRESISSMKRADIIVLTKVDMIDEYNKEVLVKKIEAIIPEKPIIMTRHRISYLNDVTGAIFQAKSLFLKKTCLVSGIGDPDYFKFLVKEKGSNVTVCFDYPDHYAYDQRDVNLIYKRCREENIEKIVTTAKDHVKLRELDISQIEEKLIVVNIVINIISGEEKLNARLDRFGPGKRT
ncbi:MAG: tetraacyldisaccharide 4'-kinase [Candidatus Omnitrophota bacterium]